MRPTTARVSAGQRDTAIAALRELAVAVEAFRLTVARHFGIGTTESQALTHLVAHDGLGQTELAAALGITTGSATSLVDRLEANGFVQRRPHPGDRRRLTVHLAPRSWELLDQARDWIFTAFDGIPAPELGPAVEVLASVAEHLNRRVAQVAGADRPS